MKLKGISERILDFKHDYYFDDYYSHSESNCSIFGAKSSKRI